MENKQKPQRINIITLGNSAVGKTCFIIRFSDDTFRQNYLATFGMDFRIKQIELENGKICKVYFYDTAGQEKFKSISLNAIKNANGVLLMYDVTNKISFDSISEWMKNIKEEKGDTFPVVLVGNKIDLKEKRVISKEDGQDLADKYGISFFETSNLSGENIYEAGVKLVNTIVGEMERESLKIDTTKNIKLSKEHKRKDKKKKKCC